MALGATVCNAKIYNAYVNDDKLKLFSGHSFTANPLACSAALGSMDLLIKPETKRAIEFISESNRDFMQTVVSKFASNSLLPYRICVRSAPFSLSRLTKAKDEYLNNVGQLLILWCMNAGVYIRPTGSYVYIMPPYCVTVDQLQKVYDVLLTVLV